MKVNKSFLTVALIATCALCLFGCGNNDVKVIDGNGGSTSSTTESASDGYVFSYKNISPKILSEAPLLLFT
jgi:hypothetical protein